MRKKRTWKDNLNNVIRDVLFCDDELLDYMMIPEEERDDIIRFIEKYFIRNPAPDELVTKENVRVCYSELEGTSMGSNILKKYIYFDVFVKDSHLHDVGDDMLQFRTDCICQKLKEDLTDTKYVCLLDFTYVDDFQLHTKVANYTRHRIIFSYKISF